MDIASRYIIRICKAEMALDSLIRCMTLPVWMLMATFFGSRKKDQKNKDPRIPFLSPCYLIVASLLPRIGSIGRSFQTK